MDEKSWDTLYRNETDRGNRKELLDWAEKNDSIPVDELSLRRRLWESRYDMKKGQQIDYFIRGWVRLNALREAARSARMKEKERKEIEGILSDWQYALCSEYGKTGERVLYDELYNTARLYIELCEQDRRYNAVALGVGHIKEEKRIEKIAAEFRVMLSDIPQRLGRGQEFALFVKAASDAFCDRYPLHVSLLKS